VKIYVATVGSRGDNEPFAALALEAAAAGHEVYFCAHRRHRPTTHCPLHRLSAARVDRGGDCPPRGFRGQGPEELFLGDETPHGGILAETTKQILALKPDVVVYHPKVLTAATAAHALGGIAIRAEMVPMLNPTDEFAPVGMPAWIPASWNKASYRIIDASLSAFDGQAKKLARRLGVISTQPDLTFVPREPQHHLSSQGLAR